MTDDAAYGTTVHDPFGFDLPEGEWLSRVSRASTAADLGVLGEYVLLGEIGRGAQGIVYKAVQPRTRRTVALKTLAGGSLASRNRRARFEREVEAACLLSHPGIVTVHGVEVLDGQPVLTMEWVEGDPIDRWANGRDTREVLAVFADACDAVAHAHRRGVLHRDLKPSNIMVDRQGRARVLDFGLAKPLDHAWSTGTLTHVPGFLGTPAYAPPEALNDPPDLDTRSDVYALGILLYRLAAGVLPFDASRGVAHLFDQVRAGVPRPPSAHRPGLSAEIDAITLRATAIEPQRRYASPDELAADVRRHLAGEPVAAHPPGRAYHLRKFVARHRVGVSLAAGALTLVLIFAVTAGVLAYNLSNEREHLKTALQGEHAAKTEAIEATRAEVAARRDAERSAAEANAALARATRQNARYRAASEALDRMTLDGGWDTLGYGGSSRRGDAPGPLQDARVSRELVRSLQRAGLYDQALEHAEEAVRLTRDAEGPRGASHAGALGLRAETLALLGRLPEAERDFRESLAIREEAKGDDAIIVPALVDLAWTVLQQGRAPEAETIFRRAIAVRESVRAGSSASIRRDLGLALLEQGRLEEAEVETRAALNALAAQRGPSGEATLRARRNLIRILHETGRVEEAEAQTRRLIADLTGPPGEPEPPGPRPR